MDSNDDSEQFSSNDEVLADITDEYIARLRNGECPAVEEYIARYPEQANILKRVLPTIALFRALGPADVSPRQAIGDYRIVREIGRGGMGIVYEAVHQTLNRRVAIKALFLEGMVGTDEIARFHREARATAQLNHPNVVTIFDARSDDGVHYLVMEYVEGRALSSIGSSRDPLSAHEAIRIIVQVARAMEYAHREGVIHRDIKPSNLMVDDRGVVKVLDLGLARWLPDTLDGQPFDTSITNTGQIAGTVDYMSPEQATDSRKADARSDIYSLGCTLCYLLTVSPPFLAPSFAEKLLAHQQVPPPKLTMRNANIPIELDAIFRKMVAKRPADRFQSMAEVIRALEPFSDPAHAAEKPRLGKFRRRAMRWSLVVGALVVLWGGIASMRDAHWIGKSVSDRANQQEAALQEIREPSVAVSPFSAKQAAAYQESWAAALSIPREFRNSLEMAFVLIPPGRFIMGDDMVEESAPAHVVTLTEPYYLGVCEVTQGQYETVMGKNPSVFLSLEAESNLGRASSNADYPVETVLWEQAVTFCQTLSDLESERSHRRHYHLPTEAQWEFADRGGDAGRVVSPSSRTTEFAWMIENSDRHPHRVGMLVPNAFGLLDMQGNVYEWCSDWKGPYSSSAQTDPRGPTEGDRRVRRGGAYLTARSGMMYGFRHSCEPGQRSPYTGFRVVCTLDPSPVN